jgi:hypothetical protein
MPKSKPAAQLPMSVQPSEHGSTMPTLSLPRPPTANSKSAIPRQKKRQPDEEAVRAARAREGIRLDALRKQRKVMKS